MGITIRSSDSPKDFCDIQIGDKRYKFPDGARIGYNGKSVSLDDKELSEDELSQYLINKDMTAEIQALLDKPPFSGIMPLAKYNFPADKIASVSNKGIHLNNELVSEEDLNKYFIR